MPNFGQPEPCSVSLFSLCSFSGMPHACHRGTSTLSLHVYHIFHLSTLIARPLPLRSFSLLNNSHYAYSVSGNFYIQDVSSHIPLTLGSGHSHSLFSSFSLCHRHLIGWNSYLTPASPPSCCNWWHSFCHFGERYICLPTSAPTWKQITHARVPHAHSASDIRAFGQRHPTPYSHTFHITVWQIPLKAMFPPYQCPIIISIPHTWFSSSW